MLFLFLIGLLCLVFQQTTYENFRYRYDKRENPYNKGLLRNIKDVFFTKIPPSLNDFRSWVLELDACSTASNGGMSIKRSKEMIDLEIGNVSDLGSNRQFSSVLQNLDCSSIDDKLHDKVRSKEDDSYPLAFPATEEPIEEDPLYSKSSCLKGSGVITDDHSDQESYWKHKSANVDGDHHPHGA